MRLANATFITRDLNATLAFYRDLLGYQVLAVSPITDPKSRATVGALVDEDVRIAYLAPAGWQSPESGEASPSMAFDADSRAGLGFIEVPSATESGLGTSGQRQARAGEAILAHRVTGLAEIARRLSEAGATIVQPYGPSGSGRSMSMAVLDPGGMRIELYEY